MVETVGNEGDENIDRDRRMQSGSTGLHNGVCIAGRLPRLSSPLFVSQGCFDKNAEGSCKSHGCDNLTVSYDLHRYPTCEYLIIVHVAFILTHKGNPFLWNF